MTREEQIKARTRELTALWERLERREITAPEALMAAYKLGSDDAVQQASDMVDRLRGKLRTGEG